MGRSDTDDRTDSRGEYTMPRRLSHTDKLSYIYTKVPDWVYDAVAEFSRNAGVSMYEGTRQIVYRGLSAALAAGQTTIGKE